MTNIKKFNKPFYYRLIKVETLYLHVNRLRLQQDEEKEIWDMIEQMIHTSIVDKILEKLPSGAREVFLERFTSSPDDETLLTFVRENTTDIETDLDKVFLDLEKEIKQDLGDI